MTNVAVTTQPCETCGQTFIEEPCPFCSTLTREEATRKLQYALRRIGEMDAEEAMHHRLLGEQIEELELGYAQVVAPIREKREHYSPQVEPLARYLLATDPVGKRRTVTVTSGAVEFRAGRERVIVEDAEAAAAFLGDACVRQTTEVVIPEVRKRFQVKGERFQTEDGEIVPGLRIEVGPESVTAKPAKIGR